LACSWRRRDSPRTGAERGPRQRHRAYRLMEERPPQDKTTLQRQIEATDQQIDRLVYVLYGLTEEEIKIVEGGA
jgi:hypothetical protein